VGIVAPSARDDSDLDYLFVQVVVGEDRVDTTPNCGNILAGVGAFAIETGMLAVQGEETTIRVYMVNSGNRCELLMQTPDGRVEYEGSARIDGVPGSAAPVICNYLDIAGSACGLLLPTGNQRDEILGVPVTCIDNGMPVVVIPAAEMGKSGYESCQELEADNNFRERLEAIRIEAGVLMNLGDVLRKVVPKMSLISAPLNGGQVCTRTFIPHKCHAAIGVLGAVSVATACVMPDSVATGIASVPDGQTKKFSVEHPSGEFSVELSLDKDNNVIGAGLLRTTRLLSKGEAFYVGKYE
ncbi:MAG: 4-oxalomesaconate tautomerase, partial [Gammaproteobacteria bacterium]|nr:4-oxalomesaconate tautomerase [Gammaproteobacteria bacterium]